jgi:FKBP-type peptidyl-prolyl cis-trans isomerase (trigger factor)
VRLLIIAREIAERDRIGVSEQQLAVVLQRMAAAAGTSVETLCERLVAANQINSLREALLVEAVLDHLVQSRSVFTKPRVS